MGFRRNKKASNVPQKGDKERSYKGRYYPRHPQKYRGNIDNIIFRSLWERRVMVWLDENINVVEWASEPFRIPYQSPGDGKWHGYWPDFWAKMKNKDGKTFAIVIEIKPEKETMPPKPIEETIDGKTISNKTKKSYIHEAFKWGINQAKWKAAQEYCKERNWFFAVRTEKSLPGLKGIK